MPQSWIVFPLPFSFASTAAASSGGTGLPERQAKRIEDKSCFSSRPVSSSGLKCAGPANTQLASWFCN